MTRPRHPLVGLLLQVLGRMLRHGAVEFLVVLPDGSKTLMPAGFTDAVVAVQAGAPTVGSVDDLVQLVVVVESLMSPPVGAEEATGIPAKEGSRASVKSAGLRPGRGVGLAGASGVGSSSGLSARPGSGVGRAADGVVDRPVSRGRRAGR